MNKATAISLNGNSIDVLNDLYGMVKPGFESLLEKFQGLSGDLTPSSLEGLLEKFNTGMETLGLAKNLFQGDVPDVLGNLSGLTETFFEHLPDATDQAANLAEEMDESPKMDMVPR
ncbi:MAG: hypothetical protein GY710_14785 [Desulfobacteraceae bacterium]|nr:hypothetical protein [Desulfobacteraceae bacterium]